MEAFALLKFWKSNTAKVAAGNTSTDGDAVETADEPLEARIRDLPTAPSDDDDSFFELELTLPNSEISKPHPCCSGNPKQERQIDLKPNPKRKQKSPISILRSAPPKLRVLMFGKFNRRTTKKDVVETENVSCSTPNTDSVSKHITVKFKIEDGSIVPELSRTDSSSSSLSVSSNKYHRRSFDDCCESSKRFSKDVVQKYIHLIKPLYMKSSNFVSSPANPTPSLRKHREDKQSNRFRVKNRHLGKSKSASSVIVASSPAPVSFPARSEHSYDGIEGAILHCKRSLNSSKGNPSLSRCNSDPSHEKSLSVSDEI